MTCDLTRKVKMVLEHGRGPSFLGQAWTWGSLLRLGVPVPWIQSPCQHLRASLWGPCERTGVNSWVPLEYYLLPNLSSSVPMRAPVTVPPSSVALSRFPGNVSSVGLP